ncbi:hypothetical protein ACJRO7_017282 [Eucalyptus globulus]|uniref:Secreted protein n=1 Tax=Eucalyptus globulus TaxID=34317 RepID=A0ABD3KPN2_EUCGL
MYTKDKNQALSPLILLASWISRGMMVTPFVWIARAHVGVLEEPHQVHLHGPLQRHQQLLALLVLPNLLERHCAGAEAMGLLHMLPVAGANLHTALLAS